MYRLARPVLFRLSPETAHHVTFSLLRAGGPVARGLARAFCGSPDPRLAVDVAGMRWAGPVGLAAGLDKDGVLARFWPNLGFGAVELGTVTAKPQPGNPKPRLFRFPEQRALINRMGFNNGGSAALAERLRPICASGGLPVPVGVNLGKSKVTPLEDAAEDYAISTERVAGLADYLVINVSSPNTPGLRSLQDPEHLRAILAAVVDRSEGRPVLVKLAPDLGDPALVEAVGVAEEGGAAGIIATNTTIERTGLDPARAEAVGAGGLSGRPLRRRALEVIGLVARSTSLPVIGVGGIDSPEGVLDALAAGATAVQIYTGLIYEGPGLVHRINRALVARMERDGIADVGELARQRAAQAA